jgi:multidrug efflux pump subunit AcrA (membrane-fusion protein)
MQFLRRSLIGIFLLSLSVALLATAGQSIRTAVQDRADSAGRPGTARERVFSVNVIAVKPQTITPELRTFGEVRSRRTLELRAPAGGRLVHLAEGFEDGAEVRAGELLAQIDPSDARSARDLVETDLSRAEAELRDAIRALDLAADDLAAARAQAVLRATALTRQLDLADRGVGSAAAVETAELALSSAEQAVVSRRQAQAQAEARRDQADTALARQRITVAEAERRLAETGIMADFDGALAEVAVVAGGLVSANERLAVLIDPDDMEVSFRLSTVQFARLLSEDGRPGAAPVMISLDMMGAEIVTTGQVTRVGAAVGEGQTGRLLYATLDSPRGFRPGDFVTVTVQEPPLSGVALLPSSAVDAAGGVLVVGEGDRLETVATQILRRQGNEVIVAAAPLEGLEVVAERAPTLGAGIRVRPIRPASEDDTAMVTPTDAPTMVVLSAERRAELIAKVEGNARMPAETKARILAQLSQDMVPAQVIAQLEARRGG